MGAQKPELTTFCDSDVCIVRQHDGILRELLQVARKDRDMDGVWKGLDS